MEFEGPFSCVRLTTLSVVAISSIAGKLSLCAFHFHKMGRNASNGHFKFKFFFFHDQLTLINLALNPPSTDTMIQLA
jgi:hypothetical protein